MNEINFVGIYQLCMICGARSELSETEFSLTEKGWILEINFAICPECRNALFEMIRNFRKSKSE